MMSGGSNLKLGRKCSSSVFVRFWGRSREELDFSLILQNQISGERGDGNWLGTEKKS